VILFVLLTGKLPFYGKTEQDLRSRVVQGEFSIKSPSWAKISDEAKDLLRGLLRVDITKRLSIQEAMVHPWLQSGTQATFDILNLKKLSNFRFGQKFQQAVSMFIASQLVSKETLVKLSVEFRNLDQDGDGKISREELLTAYSKIMNRTQALEEVDKVMKKIDLNESGFIDYSEFITACLKTETIANQENLVLAFERFDADGNGKLTVEELKKLLGSGLADLEEVQKIVKEVDLNGDGEIDLKEFQGMMFRQFSP
jgi:calcium-dependent protein kinase